MAKPKLALYWAGACGGCDVAVLDTNEKILDIAALADIVLWPIAVDFKYHHIEAMADGTIDLCLFNGCIRNSEQEHLAKLLRAKSKVMVAFGACAILGGIPALANFTNRAEIWERVYVEAQSMDGNKTFPQTMTKANEGELTLPEMYDTVFTLPQVVKVEYFIPGCPPPVDLILKAVNAFATGTLPPVGSIIASDKALCEECERIKEDKKITKIFRSHQIIPDPKKCLLEQGIICCGPATRGGCKARCIEVNMPCRGCYGPPPGVIDQGAKLLSAISSLVCATQDDEVEAILSDIKDTIGNFYQFTLAKSILKGAVK